MEILDLEEGGGETGTGVGWTDRKMEREKESSGKLRVTGKDEEECGTE